MKLPHSLPHFLPLGHFIVLTLCIASHAQLTQASDVYFAQGMKIGEATSESVLVWTRVSTQPRIDPDSQRTPPAEAEVRFRWAPTAVQKSSVDIDWKVSQWMRVDPNNDSALRYTIDGLSAGTEYQVTAEARSIDTQQHEGVVAEHRGQFRTARSASDETPFRFVVMTCQRYDGLDDGQDGFLSYKTLSQGADGDSTDLEFMSFTGDAVYYDQEPLIAKDVSTAQAHWHRMYSLPNLVKLHSEMVCYFIADDHDILRDDCWPGREYGDLTFAKGIQIYRNQNPIGDNPYRSVRWGKHLQVWFTEGREFRSPNKIPDGPEKTILGEKQKEWLQQSIEGSDATFKVLVQATPTLGPDRKKKTDNHANAAFKTEGDWLRTIMAKHDVISVNGDRHWQYVTQDPELQIFEFGTGPAHDARAGGWNPSDRKDQHQFLRVKGGYLMGEITGTGSEAMLRFTHHDVYGAEVSRTVFNAQ